MGDVFQAIGGGTIAEVTNHGLGRNMDHLLRISQETGVHIVAGTGMR